MLAPEASAQLHAVVPLPMIVPITIPYVVDIRQEKHRQNDLSPPPMDHVRLCLQHGMHTAQLYMNPTVLADLTKASLTVGDGPAVRVEVVPAKAAVNTMRILAR